MTRYILAGILSALVGATAGASCGYPETNKLCLDHTFTSRERVMFQTAIDRWNDVTAGRPNLELSCEAQYENVWRVTSDNAYVKSEDEAIHGEVVGITTKLGIFIVVDRVGDSEQAVIQHELGHFIGLKWPGCDAPASDAKARSACVHVPQSEAPAIMTPALSGATDFTEADLRFCRASGFCAPSSTDAGGESED